MKKAYRMVQLSIDDNEGYYDKSDSDTNSGFGTVESADENAEANRGRGFGTVGSKKVDFEKSQQGGKMMEKGFFENPKILNENKALYSVFKQETRNIVNVQSAIAGNTADIAENTSNISDKMSIVAENMANALSVDANAAKKQVEVINQPWNERYIQSGQY